MGVGVGVDFIINNVDLFYYYTTHMLPILLPTPAAKPVEQY